MRFYKAGARRAQEGFTLIELMIVVAIIGVLAAIAIPQFADLTKKSREGTTKANLGVIRSALAIYYGDTEGSYPTDNLSSLIPRYIKDIPMKDTPPYHPKGNSVSDGDDAAMTTAHGDYFYFSVPFSTEWGKVVINCIHQDLSGRIWSTF